MKREFDIEYLQLNLKQDIDLLKCFDEFCNEGIISPTQSLADSATEAILFTNKLKVRRSLLDVAIENLQKNYELLEEFIGSHSFTEVQRNG